MGKVKTKVCYILSYKDPTYIRTQTLLAALESIDNVKVFRAINTSRGWLKYLQTFYMILLIRARHHPDIYILGFRGQEIFVPVRIFTLGKPLVFDEFMNIYLVLTKEHNILNNPIGRFCIRLYMKLCVLASNRVLTDTEPHAQSSIYDYKVAPRKYSAIPVGADEAETKVSSDKEPSNVTRKFKVLFYGTMLPLHGMEYINQAAEAVWEKNRNIDITVVGKPLGRFKKNAELASQPRCVRRILWLEMSELKQEIFNADLCLGGPFGATAQADLVITGKTYQFLAMGKAVVVGRNKATRSMFIDKENCLLVERANSKALADTILWAAANRSDLRKIGNNGKKLYDKQLSILAISQQLEKLIEEI